MSNRQIKREARERARLRYLDELGLVGHVPPELAQPDQGLFVEAAPGVHTWAAIATYRLTDDECLDAHREGQKVLTGLHNLVAFMGPLCLVCERPWVDAHSQPCAGQASPDLVPPRYPPSSGKVEEP